MCCFVIKPFFVLAAWRVYVYMFLFRRMVVRISSWARNIFVGIPITLGQPQKLPWWVRRWFYLFSPSVFSFFGFNLIIPCRSILHWSCSSLAPLKSNLVKNMIKRFFEELVHFGRFDQGNWIILRTYLNTGNAFTCFNF